MESEQRLAAALEALGIEPDTDGLTDTNARRAWFASALLGAAQAEAMAADALIMSREARYALWQRQLIASGSIEDPDALVQWQVRRACAPLPAMAQENRTDPVPLAAAQAAEGLQMLLTVGAATRGAVEQGDVKRLAAQAGRLREARKVLQAALDNTDDLLEMLRSVDL
ncbi:hypothetical protein Ade02nite_90740 [Paractinoplanes deccanensis]|uniref:Uncharacterized protein n=1 Tax=Paractinoplanes deccanensis TaxID=113561 RepID=A0ABQ3YKA0_9ACTN|nr:DUF6245 family protein [Actinoplanes deccanensis]GID80433.1 hypothetical protein Ade02nite_90740 [Actinoplanes deccanensis]